VARHGRKSSEWHLDLKPVLPTAGSVESPTHPTPTPLRTSDDAVLAGLEQIQVAVNALGAMVERLNDRLGEIEGRLAAQQVSAVQVARTRVGRQIPDPNEVRDSATASFERRPPRSRVASRRPAIQDDASGA
jgi:hypothetical protein